MTKGKSKKLEAGFYAAAFFLRLLVVLGFSSATTSAGVGSSTGVTIGDGSSGSVGCGSAGSGTGSLIETSSIGVGGGGGGVMTSSVTGVVGVGASAGSRVGVTAFGLAE